MDITDVKSFLVFAELRSLTLSAKKLHVTQSAMSKRMHKIEDELGIRLFILDKATINLTKEAKSIIPYMRQIHAAFEGMTKTIRESSSSTRILAGASVYVSHYVLPSFINYLQKSNISMEIHINTMRQNDIDGNLSQGSIDVAIFQDVDLLSSHIVKITLWEEPFYLVTNSQNDLTQKSNISYQDLLGLPAVIPKKGVEIRNIIAQQYPEARTTPKIVEVTTLESIKNLLEYNIGWSYLPKRLISSNLRILDEKNPFIVPYCVYFLKNRVEEPKIRDFLDNLDAWLHPDSQENKILW